MKNEPDRTIDNHAVDCTLYITRELPEVAKLKPSPGPAHDPRSLMSRCYWEDVATREAERQPQKDRRYRLHPMSVDDLG